MADASHLFVYGTLMSSARHPMGARLAREGRLIGSATIRGRLFDFGRYPGLVEGRPDDGRVHGEVYVLNSPQASFRWLDAYEGIIPGRAQGNDYERVLCKVVLETGSSLAAWVYLFRGDIRNARPVEGGRWRRD
jgi:gamma-glutamylcyclotransferase (GGCT)/AIG2-like uncharacterized protein YtfP